MTSFTLISERYLGELKAQARFFRHEKTGCEVFHLLNEDPENLFAFAFPTVPEDSSGVAHIVEHCVLSGSKRFPLKDSFNALSRKSVNTFLNAMTYPDKTVYPGATVLEADYFNLMDVYGDSVFFPLLREESFMQEGVRLEPDGKESASVQGVVYNEMKGAYSDLEDFIGEQSIRRLFPGHPYSHSSGGDPECIPDLTWEAFKAFHARHYTPTNCKIFLCGNIPTEKQLAFLEEKFLSKFERTETLPYVKGPLAFASPKILELPFPSAEGGGERTSVLVSWLLGETADHAESLSADILTEILLGHPGSPLYRKLVESGLGEDLAPQSGLDSNFRNLVFTVGLRGTKRTSAEELERLVMETLTELSTAGIPAESKEAALHAFEFANREIRRGRGPWSLRLMGRSLSGWLRTGDPERTLLFEAPMTEIILRMAANPRYFEDLVKTLFLDNSSRLRLTVYSDPFLVAVREQEERARCEARYKALDANAQAELTAKLEKFRIFIEADDSGKAAASIPGLHIVDIPKAIETIPRETGTAAGAQITWRGLGTNGIVYLDAAFPLDAIPHESLVWLPLFSRVVSGIGLPGRPYHQVQNDLSRLTGGFACTLDSGSIAGTQKSAAWAIFRTKALERDFTPALDLFSGLVTNADFTDSSRITDILSELVNDMISAVVPQGNDFAESRTLMGFSANHLTEERWRGLEQLAFIMALSEVKPEIIRSGLEAVRASIVSRQGLRLNLTAEPEFILKAKTMLDMFVQTMPVAPKSFDAPEIKFPKPESFEQEGWIMNSRVGYAALSVRAHKITEIEASHETILASLLGSGYLWDAIRIKGGAYGAWAKPDSLEGTISFISYRDPNPFLSIEAFKSSLAKITAEGIPQVLLEEAIVSVMGRELRPFTPEEKSFVDFRRMLYRVTDEIRRKKREEYLSTSNNQIAAAADYLLKTVNSGRIAIAAGKELFQSAETSFPGMKIREIPSRIQYTDDNL